MLDVKLNRSLYKSSTYNGSCDVYGRRDGIGSEKWREKEQKYEGAFVRDAYHGEGTYIWCTGKSRHVYEGQFYSNLKEGYGVVSLPDGSTFEGLFYNNRAFGPGIHTQLDGRQDVGFWSGSRIVRLSRPVEFIIPRLAPTLAGRLKLLQFHTLLPYTEENIDIASAILLKLGFDSAQSGLLYSNFINDPRSLFFNKIGFDEKYFRPKRALRPEWEGLATLRSPCVTEQEFKCPCGPPDPPQGSSSELGLLRYLSTMDPTATAKSPSSEQPGEAEDEDATLLISWNRSELCMEILKQIFRFRSFEDRLTFRIADLMAGMRTGFRKTGYVERVCLYFLKMCSTGPPHVIRELFCAENISESLMDSRGNNCIMFAAASDQHEIIEILLDQGADVNAFNDENLTPLNLCLLRRLAHTESLGNWETSFLNPDADPFDVVDGKGKNWKVSESIEGLDKVFGDGMSLDDNVENQTGNVPVTDSYFCFKDDLENGAQSTLTLVSYKTETETETDTKEKESRSISTITANNDRTIEVGKSFVPDDWKREEYVKSVAEPTEKDRYLFDVAPKPYSAKSNQKETTVDEETKDGRGESSQSINKLAEIDKTIAILLMRGADPNLGDVPKPSLHLAVYSRDLELVRLLLMNGASPDCQSLPQEGLLTPLHVIALMEPSQEQLDICELLLNYGASPEEKTSPSFNPGREDESHLDPDHGRTPLQLLCSRRDAEYVDPDGFLSRLALLLASVSKRRHFFKGHSYLTLAMIYGNVTLMKSLLKCRKIDPNEVLGNNLGTAFHVLLSTSLQKRTTYEDSVRMCDMLLRSGGDPEIFFHGPSSPVGNCLDYGYREIEAEKRRREVLSAKPDSGRDHLEDHMKIVSYLAGKSSARGERPAGKNEARGKFRGRRMLEQREKERPEKKCRVIKIKKYVTVAKEKVVPKRDDQPKEKAAEPPDKPKPVPAQATKKKSKRTDFCVPPKERRSRSLSRSRFSEKLPERFRESLLHVLQMHGGTFDLNDLLLPYVVLRNGDLYYRFKEQKSVGMEQYSLI
ncbi:UNVERIFIED_CONTAM: hypothetical protein PYX00_001534 [Menopon gallinae]|uniref:Ankyrin repeat and MYND domain-containing protein 1 n=1 Tax=Menopon gallinae TaxID=328185 RepID=A0AAW2IEN2_9NEOP